MTDALHLILGDEELLVERAVTSVLHAVRGKAGADIPVNRLRAGQVDVAELAELLSPSLFADERVIVIEAAAEAGKDAVTLIEQAAPICRPEPFCSSSIRAAVVRRRWPPRCRTWAPRFTTAHASPRPLSGRTSCTRSFVAWGRRWTPMWWPS